MYLCAACCRPRWLGADTEEIAKAEGLRHTSGPAFGRRLGRPQVHPGAHLGLGRRSASERGRSAPKAPGRALPTFLYREAYFPPRPTKMVRSVAHGQFRVTWALDELASGPEEGTPVEEAGDQGTASAVLAPALGSDGPPFPAFESPEPEPFAPPTPADDATAGGEAGDDPGPLAAFLPIPSTIGLSDPATAPPSPMLATRRSSAKETTTEEEGQEQADGPSGSEPAPKVTAPPPGEVGPPSSEPGAPPPQEEAVLAATPRFTETAIVRRVPRGQFRVLSAWHELPPATVPVEPAPRARGEEEPAIAPAHAIRFLLARRVDRRTPEPVAIPLRGAEGTPSVSPPAPSTPASPPEPSRTLLGLLARMWLLRAASATSGGLALAQPPAPSAPPASSGAPAPLAPSAPPSVPPKPPVAVAPPPPAPVPSPSPRLEPVVPVAPPPPTPAPPPSPVPEPASRDRPWPYLPDLDDRHPVSGLASLLAEVAEASHPSSPPEPILTASMRPREVVRLIHCRHPIPERPVSRDTCRQPRVGR
jgi:hypothetical protein